jgi:hypothetical protein
VAGIGMMEAVPDESRPRMGGNWPALAAYGLVLPAASWIPVEAREQAAATLEAEVLSSSMPPDESPPTGNTDGSR